MGPNLFKPMHIEGDGKSLADANLDPDKDIFFFERSGKQRAILVDDLQFPHVAQGTLGDEPFVISFCPVCNGAVGMDPRVNLPGCQVL